MIDLIGKVERHPRVRRLQARRRMRAYLLPEAEATARGVEAMIRSIDQSGTDGKAKKRHTGVFGIDPLTEDAGTRLPCRLVKVIFDSSPLDQEVCERLGWIRDRYSPVRVDPKHNGGFPVRPVGVLCSLLPSSVSDHLSPHYRAENTSKFGIETLLVRGLPCYATLINAGGWVR